MLTDLFAERISRLLADPGAAAGECGATGLPQLRGAVHGQQGGPLYPLRSRLAVLYLQSKKTRVQEAALLGSSIFCAAVHGRQGRPLSSLGDFEVCVCFASIESAFRLMRRRCWGFATLLLFSLCHGQRDGLFDV